MSIKAALPASGTGANGNATLTGGTSCQACPRRTFRPSIYAKNECTICPTGRETRRETGASVCTACIPGTSLLTASGLLNVNCTACPAGTAAEEPGTTGTCKACAAGTAVADTGNQRCDVCAPGTDQNSTGTLTCLDCPVGTYNERTGAKALAECLPAPAGNYAEGSGNDGFTPCLGGTYQDKPGQGSCKDCPPGNACPAGSAKPKECSPGFFADMKQPFCRECPKGQYQDRKAQRACKACPAGAYCPGTKTITPVKCPPGTYGTQLSATTATACIKCPINVSGALVLLVLLQQRRPVAATTHSVPFRLPCCHPCRRALPSLADLRRCLRSQLLQEVPCQPVDRPHHRRQDLLVRQPAGAAQRTAVNACNGSSVLLPCPPCFSNFALIKHALSYGIGTVDSSYCHVSQLSQCLLRSTAHWRQPAPKASSGDELAHPPSAPFTGPQLLAPLSFVVILHRHHDLPSCSCACPAPVAAPPRLYCLTISPCCAELPLPRLSTAAFKPFRQSIRKCTEMQSKQLGPSCLRGTRVGRGAAAPPRRRRGPGVPPTTCAPPRIALDPMHPPPTPPPAEVHT